MNNLLSSQADRKTAFLFLVVFSFSFLAVVINVSLAQLLTFTILLSLVGFIAIEFQVRGLLLLIFLEFMTFPFYKFGIDFTRFEKVLVYGIFFALIFVTFVIRGKKHFFNEIVEMVEQNWALVGFLFLGLISLYFTPAPHYGFLKVLLLISVLFSMIVFNFLITHQDQIISIRAILLLSSLVGIPFMVSSLLSAEGEVARLGIYQQSGHLAAGRGLGIGLLAAFSYYINAKNSLKRFSWLFFMLIFFLFILLSGTRQALLSISMAIMTMTILTHHTKKRSILKENSIVLISFLAFVLILISTVGFSEIPILERIIENPEEPFNSAISTISENTRFNWHYQQAISLFQAHPFIGGGIGSYAHWVTGKDVEHVYPHNILLEIAGELGLLGLILFGFFLFKLVKSQLVILYSTEMKAGFRDVSIFFSGLWVYLFGNSLFTGDLLGNSGFLIFSVFIIVLGKYCE